MRNVLLMMLAWARADKLAVRIDNEIAKSEKSGDAVSPRAWQLLGQKQKHAAIGAIARSVHKDRDRGRSQGDIYEFGVFTGGGLKAWVDLFSSHKIKFGTLWGFDSFAGLPSIRAHEAGYQDQGDLRAGQFNALRYLRRDFAQFEAELQSLVKYDRMRLVRGFYNESLPALSASTIAQMQPAVLIDFDGDFYESTIGPYEFLWRHCLVAVGTFVYYDDFQVCHPHHLPLCGEGKAHVEVTARFNVSWEQLKPNVFRVRAFDAPHCYATRSARGGRAGAGAKT